MKFYQKWMGTAIDKEGNCTAFPANVPGNIQSDYADFSGMGDFNYRINCEEYKKLEEYTWRYTTEPVIEARENERVFFFSRGIDYFSSVELNGVELLRHEGMYSDIEVDITDYLKEKNVLTVTVYPHPKRKSAVKYTRDEADTSVKAPVCYGWDWHPRLLFSGIWDETYIETRTADYIKDVTIRYKLSDDYKNVEGSFEIDCAGEPAAELFDADGRCVYSGNGDNFSIQNVNLWWCAGHGEPYLYRWRVTNGSSSLEGTVGFKSAKLVMADGEWRKPRSYPMSRSNPPICMELNGKRIFAKGTNLASPEVFIGKIRKERYEYLLKLIKDANMNIVRMWGGCGIQKQCFYELCDHYGIMVWQEFPLACNCYGRNDGKHYCEVLKSEAESIVKRLRRHASLVMWCGGNELFNNWSAMTEQSLPLRLLDEICYELNPEIPFIMTAPLSGMAHGPYNFYSNSSGDVITLFQNTEATAYTEFGCRSVSGPEYLKQFMTEEEAERPYPDKNGPWTLHHAFDTNSPPEAVLFEEPCRRFGLKHDTIDEIHKASIWLQCEGLRFIFEESRRQQPTCSMAINWYFTDPWQVAAGFSIVRYPDVILPSYYYVKDALRPVLASARIQKFDWRCGEKFSAELWLLNDTGCETEDVIDAYIILGDRKEHLVKWYTGKTNGNKQGPTVNVILPQADTDYIILRLEAQGGNNSEYKYRYYPPVKNIKPELKVMNSTNDF